MEHRSIGGIEVSLLGLGTSRLASLGGRISRSEAARLIDTARDAGVTFIDTADTYGSGDCERLLGDLLATRPGHFSVATKGGYVFSDLPGPLRHLNQFAKKAQQLVSDPQIDSEPQNFDPRRIRRRIDGSLRRLRRDVLDVYYLHEPLLPVIAQDDLIGVLVDAKAKGKIRCLGVASDTPEVLNAAAATGVFDVVQTAINEKSATDFAAFGPTLVASGLAVVANQVLLGMGEPSVRDSVPNAGSLRYPATRTALLRRAAGQIGVCSVLTGTSRSDHLRENAAALEAPLTEEDR